ncbi:MerR family transcriptional regulator [Streptomyces sp. SL13]|uniref:MerR family transcriptional regulator n=2 Tax=Streptantibioticus silvisoli TaxID=2705255 RepID=A0AA90H860_9ACTN|nr:MerR family transcriptional regulator [Streptantibioticus silvisoli]
MAELAKEAGVSVRTLRFYRERRLLPPPRRQGRIAWYGDAHLARLRTVAALLERGHTLGGIADLIAAWENGRDVGELLGLESALATPWSEETPVRLTPPELADSFGADVTADNLATALDIGYIAVDGDDVVHVSRRLLDASAALVREGVPLSAVLATGREVRRHVDALADLFTVLTRTHVIDAAAPDLPAGAATRLAEALDRLRPLAKNVVEAELSMAMDRRVTTELDAWLSTRTPAPAAPADAPPAPADAPAADSTPDHAADSAPDAVARPAADSAPDAVADPGAASARGEAPRR